MGNEDLSTQVNTLLRFLRDFGTAALVKEYYYGRYSNRAPVQLLEAQINHVQNLLDREKGLALPEKQDKPALPPREAIYPAAVQANANITGGKEPWEGNAVEIDYGNRVLAQCDVSAISTRELEAELKRRKEFEDQEKARQRKLREVWVECPLCPGRPPAVLTCPVCAGKKEILAHKSR